MEALIDASSGPDDKVDGWLDPAIDRRLIDANISTLGVLVTAINSRGFRWYTKVPRLGIEAAQQIVDWRMLPETVEPLGMRLAVRGIVPRNDLTSGMLALAPIQTAIVPLENFLVPHDLNGAFGSNRGERSSLPARNDLEAMSTWLARYKPGGHIHRAYRKEAERFLLWSILERGKPLSSLMVEDCIAYRDFLWHLGRQTAEAWAQSYCIRSNIGWAQRYRAPLCPLAAFRRAALGELTKTALVILQSTLQWLSKQNYLHTNSFRALLHLAKRPTNHIDSSRTLTVAEGKLVKQNLSALPHDQRYYRLRFILALAYSSGCRLSELVSLRRSDLRSFIRAGEDDLHWEIVVNGKGEMLRTVQLNPQVGGEIRRYLESHGHAAWSDVPSDIPLIAALPPADPLGSADEPLSASRLYRVLRDFFVARRHQ